jgi:hypothetical protein
MTQKSDNPIDVILGMAMALLWIVAVGWISVIGNSILHKSPIIGIKKTTDYFAWLWYRHD